MYVMVFDKPYRAGYCFYTLVTEITCSYLILSYRWDSNNYSSQTIMASNKILPQMNVGFQMV